MELFITTAVRTSDPAWLRVFRSPVCVDYIKPSAFSSLLNTRDQVSYDTAVLSLFELLSFLFTIKAVGQWRRSAFSSGDEYGAQAR
jgi:hypothetical protein